MSATVDLCLPGLPDCWESCGNCSDGTLTVVEILVVPGEQVAVDQPLLVLETDKTTLDIPAERAGRVRHSAPRAALPLRRPIITRPICSSRPPGSTRS